MLVNGERQIMFGSRLKCVMNNTYDVLQFKRESSHLEKVAVCYKTNEI